jgi:hypothetical protein
MNKFHVSMHLQVFLIANHFRSRLRRTRGQAMHETTGAASTTYDDLWWWNTLKRRPQHCTKKSKCGRGWCEPHQMFHPHQRSPWLKKWWQLYLAKKRGDIKNEWHKNWKFLKKREKNDIKKKREEREGGFSSWPLPQLRPMIHTH